MANDSARYTLEYLEAVTGDIYVLKCSRNSAVTHESETRCFIAMKTVRHMD